MSASQHTSPAARRQRDRSRAKNARREHVDKYAGQAKAPDLDALATHFNTRAAEEGR